MVVVHPEPVLVNTKTIWWVSMGVGTGVNSPPRDKVWVMVSVQVEPLLKIWLSGLQMP